MWIQKRVDLHMDRQTLYFTVANVRVDYKEYYFLTQNSKKNSRIWANLAAPLVANSEKETYGFLM